MNTGNLRQANVAGGRRLPNPQAREVFVRTNSLPLAFQPTHNTKPGCLCLDQAVYTEVDVDGRLIIAVNLMSTTQDTHSIAHPVEEVLVMTGGIGDTFAAAAKAREGPARRWPRGLAAY